MLTATLDRFLPAALQLGDEEVLLDRAHERIEGVREGTVVVLPEFVAWTQPASERAYVVLEEMARSHQVTLVTTLNLPGVLSEDLPAAPAADEEVRHNALVVFTRHGHVHVPQAKVTPQGFEMSEALSGAGIGVRPYHRINRVQMDVGESLLDVIFLICSDLWALTRLPAAELRCDLLVVPGNFARGAEEHARQVLAAARAAGVAQATLLVNGYHVPRDAARGPLARSVEEVLTDGAAELGPLDGVALAAAHFRTLEDDDGDSFVAMVETPAREGRIAVARSRAQAPLEVGRYAVTITA